jgi:hypothetical protein
MNEPKDNATGTPRACHCSTAFEYERLRSLPIVVRQLCFNHDAWVVGGAAKFLCGLSQKKRDWDVIVPLHEWMQASKQFPHGSRTNTFGGVKIESDGFEIDIWAEDVGRYFQTAGGSFDLIAVSPKTQQVCICSKR